MFKVRSGLYELLDAADIPTADLHRNLFELDVINRYLGGHRATLKGLATLQLKPNKTYRILDIGCGGGDTLKAVAIWARANQLSVTLTGVDLKSDCIAYAKEHCKNFPEINLIQSDYRKVITEDQTFDIILQSLFCHHLNNDDLVSLIHWGHTHAKIASLINDLHRHPFAYYSIKWITKLFSSSYLVKNDAPISVLRGFSKTDLNHLFATAGIPQTRIYWYWAFRWLCIIPSAHHGN
jgi:2-polyprenyl-3-methyl-5-hydroxy-6-metoxy-1,4-benzoquinol methylase